MTKSVPDAHRSSAPRLVSFLAVLAFILAGCVRNATLNDQIPVEETPLISPNGTAARTPAKSSATARPTEMQQPFLAAIKAWNGSADFGRPLTQPAQTVDGMLEQVYENVVVYAPPKHPDQAKLRPVALMLGMLTMQAGPQKYSESDGMVFYPVSGDQGYHIPIVFKDFIDAHGGMDVAGAPIAEVLQYSLDTYRQCFTNYCLDYVTSAPDEQKVRMAPLGQMLLAASQNSGGSTDAPFVFSPSTVNLTVTAANPKVGSGEDQQISLQVETSTDHSPLVDVGASLIVYYPENKQVSLQFPATDSSGVSSVTIPAEAGLSNGTVVPYQVCLSGPSSAAVCVKETYLVWGN
jgi:hypothetical protein